MTLHQKCYIHSWGTELHPFHSMINPFSSYIPFFEKCAEWPQLHWYVQGKKTQIYIIYIPTRPKFCFVLVYNELFSSYDPFFSEKCAEWPQVTLTCSRWKITICILHTPPRLKRFFPFCSTMSLGKRAPNDPIMPLTCATSKVHIGILHTSIPKAQFSFVLLYDKLFLSYAPFWEKCTTWPPNDLDMFKVKNTNMHAI